MRKSFLGIFALLLFGLNVQAQDPIDGYKQAKKNFSKYGLEEADADKKAEFLESAKQNIDIAAAGVQSIDAKVLFDLWDLRGNIYNSISKTDSNKGILDPSHKAKYPEAAGTAYEAYQKTLELGVKKWQTAKAISNLVDVGASMSNAGRMMYTEKNYSGAFKMFEKVLVNKELLAANNNTELLGTPEELNDHMFMTGLSASISKNNEGAKKYFGKLYEADYKEPSVYDGYFRALVDTDETKAATVLSKGRELFPDDEGLLIAEINYYLKVKKLDVLVDRLKVAVEKDPTNTTYVSTLGNVYDNLSVKSAEEGNTAQSEEYFGLALEYYNKALDIDPGYHTALYNVGTLYYNKAAIYTKEMIELSNDYSKEGTVKYNAKKEEVNANFDLALPFFQKAEVIDPNDMGTLIALKEIYAKKDKLEESNEFKKRIEVSKAGGKNVPYHKM